MTTLTEWEVFVLWYVSMWLLPVIGLALIVGWWVRQEEAP